MSLLPEEPRVKYTGCKFKSRRSYKSAKPYIYPGKKRMKNKWQNNHCQRGKYSDKRFTRWKRSKKGCDDDIRSSNDSILDNISTKIAKLFPKWNYWSWLYDDDDPNDYDPDDDPGSGEYEMHCGD